MKKHIYYDDKGLVKMISEGSLKCGLSKALVHKVPTAEQDEVLRIKNGVIKRELMPEGVKKKKLQEHVASLKSIAELKQFIIDKLL